MSAPTVCAEPGCAQLVPTGQGGRCPQHARPAWASSNRRAQLPPNWRATQQAILTRDRHRCTCPGCPNCTGQPCATIAAEVDHLGDRHDHRPSNLASKCADCHRWRTRQQATAGKATR